MSKKYTVKITADYNDGDYVTSEFAIKEKELLNLKKITPVIYEVQKLVFYDWEKFQQEVADIVGEDLADWFFDHCYFDGLDDSAEVHTIESIEYSQEIKWIAV